MKGLYDILHGARAAIDRAWRRRAAKDAQDASHFMFSMDQLESRRMLSFGGGVVTISVSGASANEGNTTGGSEVFTVSLSGPSTNTITVSWSTSNGTAKSAVDYTAGSGTLTFSPETTSQTFSVAILPNLIPQPDRVFYVRLANSSNAMIARGTGVGLIMDDDPPVVSVAAITPTAVEAGAIPGAFRFSRTGATDTALRVYYGIQGSATNMVDYSRIGASVNIAAGSVFTDVTITPIQDNVLEGQENVLLRIKKNAAYVIGASKFATVDILDTGTAALTATVTKAPAVTKTSAKPYRFTVQYTGRAKINLKTINSGNIQVTGPSSSKYSPTAQIVSKKASADGKSVTAVYQVPAPSQASGNGTFTIKMVASQVKDVAGNTVASGTIGTFSVLIPDTTSPTAPTNLASTASDSASVSMSWTAATDNIGVTGYEVWRNGVKLTTTTAANYKDTTVLPSTDYAYHIIAYDAVGNRSLASNSLAIRTAPATPTAPAVVAGGTAGSVHLTWTDNATDEDGFHVFNSSDGTNWSRIATVAASAGSGSTVVYDSPAVYAGKWYFRVTSYRGTLESVASSSVNLTV